MVAQHLLVGYGQACCVIGLLEQVSDWAKVPRNFLALPVESMLAFLPSAVVINFLKAGVLLDFSQNLAVLVREVIHEDLGNMVGLFHLLGEFLCAHFLAHGVEVNCCHFVNY